jgi:hypothetical protein
VRGFISGTLGMENLDSAKDFYKEVYPDFERMTSLEPWILQLPSWFLVLQKRLMSSRTRGKVHIVIDNAHYEDLND